MSRGITIVPGDIVHTHEFLAFLREPANTSKCELIRLTLLENCTELGRRLRVRAGYPRRG